MQPISPFPVQSQKTNYEAQTKTEKSPSQELIEKACNYVSLYFTSRYPFGPKSEIVYQGFKATKVCISNPYDNLTCALPKYDEGFAITLKYNDAVVEVNIDRKGNRIYSPIVDHDEILNIPADLMLLILSRIKQLNNGMDPKNIEIIHATKTLFNKNLMTQVFHSLNHIDTISGYRIMIKCGSRTFLVAAADNPNETRIRIDEDKPAEQVHAVKRKVKNVERDESPESESSDGEIDDFGLTSKPMPIHLYKKQMEAKNLSISNKVELIPKANVMPSNVMSEVKQNLFDLLSLRYPFAEIDSHQMIFSNVRWNEQLDLKMEMRKRKVPGFNITLEYGEETFEVLANEGGDHVECKQLGALLELPQKVLDRLHQVASLEYPNEFSKENLTILEVRKERCRNVQSDQKLAHSNDVYHITINLKNCFDKIILITIDRNGVLLP